MVNTDDFLKRLETILDYYNMSASVFADKLGVQRSGLSHLLSGRNKPSLDFVLKLVDSFPEVDLYWLLNGKGNFPKQETDKNINTTSPAPSVNKQDIIANDLFSSNEENEKEADFKKVEKNEDDITEDGIEIERIVIFYKNGTFKNYIPK
ncbi:helix-turn-helix transcriptional regulator [Flavobacterium salilacus subsp. salilacus]|uniref:helix-turn-helix domain-containing protein n=1 Tax=Flavobacterium TaxID=237 RepID=UPI001074CA10|nr:MULTISPECIES: helix-turn-helix transcriptional regulator [Flavobacterium]KAF2518747.1 helix-turn-helix transcriptional regulator [Flavobacterium salilacus subsp. salilacus]MBE1613713.1 helix-turn-helix transcriptional regulator [Flavobacterium sp. SaA2.13]